jgi:hypothetical protein
MLRGLLHLATWGAAHCDCPALARRHHLRRGTHTWPFIELLAQEARLSGLGHLCQTQFAHAGLTG